MSIVLHECLQGLEVWRFGSHGRCYPQLERVEEGHGGLDIDRVVIAVDRAPDAGHGVLKGGIVADAEGVDKTRVPLQVIQADPFVTIPGTGWVEIAAA